MELKTCLGLDYYIYHSLIPFGLAVIVIHCGEKVEREEG